MRQQIIKLFADESAADVERQANEWLAENPDWKISSQSLAANPSFNYSLSLVLERDTQEDVSPGIVVGGQLG